MSVLLSVGTWAQNMTEQEAAERALQFLSEHNTSSRAKVMGNAPSRPVLKAAKVEAEKIYAFNVEGGGYVIASGDSRTLPVLGYSDSGSIDWDQMPENMRAWLKQYDDAIATLGDRTDFVDGNLVTEEGEQPAVHRAARVAIEPMVPVHWYQTAPYCNKIPLYAGDKEEWQGKVCLTGCSATAMAQIMKYHEWPKTETTAIPAYDAPRDVKDFSTTWHIDELPPVTFDWANMIDQYLVKNKETGKEEVVGTETQQDAVATLMRYCAQSIEMQLTPNLSSAISQDMINALISYFGYASTVRQIGHWAFGIDEWDDLIYNELANKRPVLYAGISPMIGGHGFICDGYDGNGLFHINWGWKGYYDGYFSLSVLSPYVDAATGFTYYTGFAFYQRAIIGIQPPSEETEQPLPLGRFELIDIFQKKDNVISFIFKYDEAMTYPPVTIDYALGTIEADGTLNPRFIGDPNDSIVLSGGNWMNVDIDPNAITPGESLVLYPMIRLRHHPEQDWWAFDTKAYFVQAGRKEDGEYYMECVKPSAKLTKLMIVDAQLNPESGRVGNTTNIILTIRNNGEEEYINKLYLRSFYYGNIKAEDITGDSPYTEGEQIWAGSCFRVGEEAQITFCFVPKQNGTVVFKLYTADFDSNLDQYMDECVMEINDPTSIEELNLQPQNSNLKPDVWYDLQGRKLDGKPTQPGAYIYRGGRKLKIDN